MSAAGPRELAAVSGHVGQTVAERQVRYVALADQLGLGSLGQPVGVQGVGWGVGRGRLAGCAITRVFRASRGAVSLPSATVERPPGSLPSSTAPVHQDRIADPDHDDGDREARRLASLGYNEGLVAAVGVDDLDADPLVGHRRRSKTDRIDAAYAAASWSSANNWTSRLYIVTGLDSLVVSRSTGSPPSGVRLQASSSPPGIWASLSMLGGANL